MAKGKYHYWITEDGLALVKHWRMNGLTIKQTANEMGVSEKQVYVWAERFPQFGEALKKGEEGHVARVEQAIEDAAVGYYVEEEKWENKWNPKKKCFELVLKERIKKWIKPDTTAQIFFLKNRAKDHWRDRQENQIDVGGTVECQPIAIIPKREILQEPGGKKGADDDEI